MSICSLQLSAQRGIHGNKTISSAGTIVNEYTSLSSSVATGKDTIHVLLSSLNDNSRFSNSLSVGDLIMIIQIQGASINGSLNGSVASPADTSWGRISNYKNCGKYEFAQVKKVLNSTTIIVDCGLKNSYDAGGTDRTQVVRVPRYLNLTVNSGGSLTCDNWDGNVGGVLAIEVQNNTFVDTGGEIDASGKGFRGGSLASDNVTGSNTGEVGSTNPTYGADKGEGVVGYQADYDLIGGRHGIGAAGNGGGGGNGNNGGGGGGANGGSLSLWKGLGIPDISGINYDIAWDMENVLLQTLNNTNSSGGGRGGYSYSTSDEDATISGPFDPAWGGDNRQLSGGYGGRPLDYTGGQLFLGGGGGAGDQNNGNGGNGANGGGLIYIMNYGTISGGGVIQSNGDDGRDAQGPPVAATYSGKDGAGGGGAGGTIVLNSIGAISGISAIANGGLGGNQNLEAGPGYTGPINEAEGPGGGGGGGYISLSNGTITQTANGGDNGITNSGALIEFTPNGATKGCKGSTNKTITNFTIATTSDTICKGTTATLTSALNGNPPSGTTLMWYDALVGGNLLNTGTTFTTPILNSTTTYYVGSCPGTYRVPVTATIDLPIAFAGINVNVCSGDSVHLNATGGLTFSWLPATGLSATNIGNPYAKPLTTTTYTVTVADALGCTATDATDVTVDPVPTASALADTTLCAGKSKQLSAGGGISYSWLPATGLSAANIANPKATPLSTITYTVVVTNSFSCSATSTVKITVNNLPPADAGTDVAICTGTSATLNASGGTTYSWLPGTGLDNPAINNPVANPSANTTYTVTVTDALGCSQTDTVVVTVNPLPTATALADTTLCAGKSKKLSAGGGTSYAWLPTAGLSVANIDNPVATPLSTTTYTVTVTNSFNCNATSSVVITVNNLPLANAGTDASICPGASTTLNASGGISFSWLPITGLTNPAINNPAANPTATTTYTITVTDANGCSNTDSVKVIINPIPVINLGSDTTACGGPVKLIAGTSVNTYLWRNATTDTSLIVSASDTIWVAATSGAGCIGHDTIVVKIFPKPAVIFTLPQSIDTLCSNMDPVVLSGGSPTGGSYSGVGVSGNIFDPVAAGVGNHTVNYTYTDTNSCIDSAQQIIHISTCVGIARLDTKNIFNIMPNPASGQLIVLANGLNIINVTIEISNIQGQQFLKKVYSTGTTQLEQRYDISEWPSGVYFIKFNSGANNSVQKFIKE